MLRTALSSCGGLRAARSACSSPALGSLRPQLRVMAHRQRQFSTSGAKAMATADDKRYRFTRRHFQPLETKPLHFDMVFDVTESKVCISTIIVGTIRACKCQLSLLVGSML